MGYDPSGCFDWGSIFNWGTFLDFALLGVAGLIGVTTTLITRNPNLGLAAFGAFNNVVNEFYYNHISDGTSDLNETSYHGRYLNRWERLDYTKSKMMELGENNSKYDFNARMYHSEYTFHAHVWWLTWWAYVQEGSDKKPIPIFSDLAGSADAAAVEKGDPYHDWNDEKLSFWNRLLRMIAYFVESYLGF